MFRCTEPSPNDLRRFAERARTAPPTYDDVGSSRDIGKPGYAPPRGFDCDFRRMPLGRGDELFEAAAAAIDRGASFQVPWVRALFPEAPPRVGDVVVVAARAFGLWWLSAARVVYLVDEAGEFGRRRGFAYGTTTEHVERGEERFVVEQSPDGRVWYDLSAFSRPQHPLVRLGYYFARRLQARFARQSYAAVLESLIGVQGVGEFDVNNRR